MLLKQFNIFIYLFSSICRSSLRFCPSSFFHIILLFSSFLPLSSLFLCRSFSLSLLFFVAHLLCHSPSMSFFFSVDLLLCQSPSLSLPIFVALVLCLLLAPSLSIFFLVTIFVAHLFF